MAFRIPHVYDFSTELRRQQGKAIQIRDNSNVRDTGQGEVQQRTC
jgi:hypothetical protein